MATPAYLEDKNKKVIYETWADYIAKYDGYKAAIRGMGAKPMSTGGAKTTFLCKFGRGAASGFVGSAGSLAHIGSDGTNPITAERKQVSMTHTTTYMRTEIDHRRIRDYEISGDLGHFLREELENQRDMFESHEQMWNTLLIRGNKGKLAVITTTGAAIADTASDDITIDGVEYVPIGMTLGVVRSSSVQSVKLLVTAQKTNGVGAGVMTVKNITGSGSYTPTENDILIPYNAYEQCFIEGIENDIAASAYPTAQANNDQITSPLFYSVVQDASNAKITPARIRMLKRKIGQQLPAALAGQLRVQNRNTGDLQSPFVLLMRSDLADQLANDLYSKRRDVGYQDQQAEPGWGYVNTIDGTPIVVMDTITTDTVYLVYFPGFSAFFSDPVPMGKGGDIGIYRNIPRTNLYEAQYEDVGSVLCVQRSAQGKITNVKGFGDSDLEAA